MECDKNKIYLSTTSTTAVLATLDESGVPIGSNNSVIKTAMINVAHSHFCAFAILVLDETKATGGLIQTMETHNNSSNLASPTEQFPYLFFSCIKWKVANVKGSWRAKGSAYFSCWWLKHVTYNWMMKNKIKLPKYIECLHYFGDLYKMFDKTTHLKHHIETLF